MTGVSIIALCSFLFVGLLFMRFGRRSRQTLPPGPTPWPIIGNLPHIPTVRPWETYHKWCQTYNSDIVSVKIPGQYIVVVGSFKVAMDLLEKRSKVYSDRARSVMSELMGIEFGFGLMPYNSKWRAHRRMFHQYFQASMVSSYNAVQLQQIRSCLSLLLDDPANTPKHVRYMISSTVILTVYGKLTDEYVTQAEKALEGISKALVPGAFWIDILPILRHLPRWFPGMNHRALIDEYRPSIVYLFDGPYFEAEAAFNNGTARPSFVTSVLEGIRETFGGLKTGEAIEQRRIARSTAGAAYGAGVDTSTSAASVFLLAMVMYPEVQKKAQAVLDKIVGPTRLPERDDMARMPYIHAVMLETLRWLPLVPFSIPHTSTEADEYEGYYIPKGATVIPNIWAMLHSPDDYPEPERFRPERFLTEDGELDPSVLNPISIVFGFGRRICPGLYFAQNTLALFIANMLHVFNIDAGVDETGSPVMLNTETTGEFVTLPKTVPRGLTPRSVAATRLIAEHRA